MNNEILISKLLIKQFVILYPLNDDVKNNLDHLSLKFLKPFLKQFKTIALGFEDFNCYLNNTTERIEYENLSFAFINENLQVTLRKSYTDCYVNKTLKKNLVYCVSIVHLVFSKIKKIRFSSVLFNNNLYIEKQQVKILSFCPLFFFKEMINFYFNQPDVIRFEIYQSPAFLQLYEASEACFKLNENLLLFKADFYLERLSGFTHFEIDKIKI